jgi:hypothetical protein
LLETPGPQVRAFFCLFRALEFALQGESDAARQPDSLLHWVFCVRIRRALVNSCGNRFSSRGGVSLKPVSLYKGVNEQDG